MAPFKAICSIIALLTTVFIATAQDNPATFPPTKNLWIIACVNGGPVKNKNSFQQLVKLLVKEYGISAEDTSELFLFVPNLTNLYQENSDEAGTQMASVPLITVAQAGLLAPKLMAQYQQATQPKLDKALGIIYPHVLVKQYFTNYSKFAYQPYVFDTIHTVVFSSQNNIYFESTSETTKAINKNETAHKKILGKWYSIVSNTNEDVYLRKSINKKIDILYVKISQITATVAPEGITKDLFTRYIKTKTDVTQERDQIHVITRFGKAVNGTKFSDFSYSFGGKFAKDFLPVSDSIVYNGTHTVPDSITMHVGFWVDDPLLGKKIIHRNYTMAFPPKAGFGDNFVVNKKWWFILLGLVLISIPVAIWLKKRQRELNNYKVGFYGIFNDVQDEKHRLPNKIQVYIFRYAKAGPAYIVLQTGHKKNHLQTFLFADGKLVITAKEKIYKQDPFFTIQAPEGSPIEVQAMRTTVWKLAKNREKTTHNNWIGTIHELATDSIQIETKQANIEMVLYAANKTLAHLHFSRSRPFPTLPDYYTHRMPALYHATNAVNQLIATQGFFPIGNCNIIICMPGQKLGLLNIDFLKNAKVELGVYAMIDAYQLPTENINELVSGFILNTKHCPTLLIGVGVSDGFALFIPSNKAMRAEVNLVTKNIMEIIEKNRIDKETPREIAKNLHISSVPFHLTYPNALSLPVFDWQVAKFPLQLVLSKEILKKTFTQKLPLSPDGILSTTFTGSKKKRYALYLSPSKNALYLKHINPIENFTFQKNVIVTIDMNLGQNQLLINGQSYDIKV